jgi:peptidoglycan/LPS O-acetylase OafA/YrhL
VPPTRSGYIPALDGLRGLSLPGTIVTHFAIFLPVLGSYPGWLRHAGPLTYNIEMFFVLSGALITSLLVREFGRTGEVSLKKFYLRRSRRLGPALVCVLPLLLIMQFAVSYGHALIPIPPLGRSPWITAVTLLTFVGNWRLFASSGGLGWMGPAWTLGIEEQFYATWPLALTIALRRRVGRPTILIGLGLLTVIATAIGVISSTHFSINRTIYMTPTQVPPILIGCALGYELTVNADGRLAHLLRSRLVALAGFGGMVWISVGWYDDRFATLHGAFALYGACAALLIGHCFVVAGEETFISRILGWKPFAIVGQLSYEAYLVHCVVILAVLRLWPHMGASRMMVLDLAIVAAFSAFFYYVIDRPIRRNGWFATLRLPARTG